VEHREQRTPLTAAIRNRLADLAAEDHQRAVRGLTWADRWADRAEPMTAPAKITGFADAQDQFHYSHRH
jgi:hypothetical protein